jgi:hypothetical protein
VDCFGLHAAVATDAVLQCSGSPEVDQSLICASLVDWVSVAWPLHLAAAAGPCSTCYIGGTDFSTAWLLSAWLAWDELCLVVLNSQSSTFCAVPGSCLLAFLQCLHACNARDQAEIDLSEASLQHSSHALVWLQVQMHTSLSPSITFLPWQKFLTPAYYRYPGCSLLGGS